MSLTSYWTEFKVMFTTKEKIKHWPRVAWHLRISYVAGYACHKTKSIVCVCCVEYGGKVTFNITPASLSNKNCLILYLQLVKLVRSSLLLESEPPIWIFTVSVLWSTQHMVSGGTLSFHELCSCTIIATIDHVDTLRQFFLNNDVDE